MSVLETLEQFVQRGEGWMDGCSISSNIEGQAGWGSGQLDLVEDIPDYCSWVGLDDLKDPFKLKSLHDSVNF